MKIAFIHCPFNHKKFAENLEVVDEEFCIAPPIVLAYVAAIAERAGHEAMLLDCRVHRLSKAEAAEKTAEFGPDLLAFRFDTYNFHQTLSWAKYLKKKLKVPVLAGGINFDLYPREAMTHKTIDFAIRGEAIYSLPKFLEVLERTRITQTRTDDKDKNTADRDGLNGSNQAELLSPGGDNKKNDGNSKQRESNNSQRVHSNLPLRENRDQAQNNHNHPPEDVENVKSINSAHSLPLSAKNTCPISRETSDKSLNLDSDSIVSNDSTEDGKSQTANRQWQIADYQGFEEVPGLIYRNQGKLKINPPAKLADLDEYPFPARHLLPNHLYSSYLTQKKPYTIMLTTTGCPYNCNFCAIAPLPYRVRSAENVLAEIKECVEKYGIREIDFFDATFFLPRKRALKIFKGIQKAGWDIEWACRTRVDAVDDEILEEAAKAGCRRIYFGIESSHPDVLAAINKQINIAQIKKAIEMAHRYGIKVMGFFMIGNPGETEESIRDSMRFAKELDLDFVQFSRTIAKPGSKLAEDLAKEMGYDYWREFVLGKAKEQRLPTPWTKLSQEEIEKYTKLAYYRFYFRPKIVIRRLLEARSFGEIWRYIRVGLKMLFHYSKEDS